MPPKVSVIIPTYNRASYLYSAIKSVLNQTFEDFEIIVVDDASTDNTKQTIDKFDDRRIYYIRHKENKGGSAARNTGIKRSKGKFIAFLDDDDMWMPSKLEKQLDLINKSLEIGVVYSGVWIINGSGKIRGSKPPFLRGNIFPDMLKKNYVGSCSTVLIRKECLSGIGLFDEDLSAGQDFDLWIRLAKHYQFDYVNEPLVLYRVHKKRVSTDPYKSLRAKKLLYKKYSKELMTSFNHRKVLGFWHYVLGTYYCKCGDIGQGKKEFVKAITSDPFSILCYVRLFASFFGSKVFDLLSGLLESLSPTLFKNK